jgi:hypothetical protein
MVLNRTIQIRLSKAQYDQVKLNCEARGFEQLSSFLRHLALAQDQLMHQLTGAPTFIQG